MNSGFVFKFPKGNSTFRDCRTPFNLIQYEFNEDSNKIMQGLLGENYELSNINSIKALNIAVFSQY